jgi:hypothetical protein
MFKEVIRFNKHKFLPILSPLRERFLIKGHLARQVFSFTKKVTMVDNAFFLPSTYKTVFESAVRRGITLARFGNAVGIKAEGVGIKFKRYSYRSNLLSLKLGFSHKIYYQFASNINMRCSKYRLLLFSNQDSNLSTIGARIRGYRPPDPYKGRGLKYTKERLKVKPGKQRLK